MKKTAVLVFTTHGDIQVRNSINPELTEEVEKFRIPEGMEIVALNAVSPSVPNLLPPKNVAPFIKIVRNATKDFKDTSKKDQMKEMVKSIRRQIVEGDDQPGTATKEIRSKNEFYTNDEEIMAYHYHSHEFLYRIRTYSTGIVLNKEYLREDKLLYKKDYDDKIVKLKSSNWKLNLLNSNINDDEDLMDTLNPNAGKSRYASLGEGFTITRLKNVIDELYSRGILKVILIDLTCSVIRKKQRGITTRGERNVAFTAIREESPQSASLGGKRTIKKHKRIKTTRKRYKK